MTGGLFDYPAQAAFGRVLPKTKIFAHGNPSRRLRDLFATEVTHVVWQHKLAPETINIPAKDGITEIQVFRIDLKEGVDSLDADILRCIDDAIPFPLIFEVTRSVAAGTAVRVAASYKRPNLTDASKMVASAHFETDWQSADTRRTPLPVALDLAMLYGELLRQIMPITARKTETTQQLVDRYQQIVGKRRECDRLRAQLQREKQFNRRVEINAQLRAATAELDALVSQDSERGTT